jgi:hypothetical protein
VNGNLTIEISSGVPNKPAVFKFMVAKKNAEILYEELLEIYKGKGPSKDPGQQSGEIKLGIGDPVFNKATGDYGVIIGLNPLEVRITTKEEAKIRSGVNSGAGGSI